MKLTLRRDDVVLRQRVDAAHQRHDERIRLYLQLEHDGVVGYGEIAPQPLALHGDPGVGEVIQELDGFVLSQLQAAVEREGALPSWTRIARFAGSRASSAPAVTLVEMALLDRELRTQGRSISELWPGHYDTPLQATASLLDDETAWIVDASVARLRVKSAPGELSDTARERLAALSVPVLLDFNCSATTVEEVSAQLASARRYATVVAVEQPFAAGNVIEHARLASQIDVPVSLDEGVRTLRDLDQIVRYGAATMVCIKPARVGGYANARTIITRALEMGLAPYVGGFFESPFARHVNAVLCRHLVREPSDIGPVVSGASEPLDQVEGGFGWAPGGATLDRATVVASFG
jgi:O-succinylbenzoate synthase